MRLIFLLALAVLFSSNCCLGVLITEVMPSPLYDETLNEWIEIYNNNSYCVNLSGYVIGDYSDNDTISGGLYNGKGTIIPAYGYGIIADYATRAFNNFNVSSNAIKLYIDDSSLTGYGLGNSRDRIFLYDSNGNILDSFEYFKTRKGFSWSLFNSSWKLTNETTPGYCNFLSKNKDFGNDDDVFFDGDNSSFCDYSAEIILEKDVFGNEDNFSFRIRALNNNPEIVSNVTLQAEIIDLTGEVIKKYKPFSDFRVLRQKTSSVYTPRLKPGFSYFISVNVTSLCNDSFMQNNFDSRIVSIKGEPFTKESEFFIERFYDLGIDNAARFGQVIKVKLNVYKGDTSKKSIALWVEDSNGNKISKQSKALIEKRYSNNSLVLPLILLPNCYGDFADGDYYVRVNGLGVIYSKEIKVKGITSSLCEKIYVSKDSSKKTHGKFSYEVLQEPLVYGNSEVISRVRLVNPEDKDLKFSMWSYVYRGSKCYSGEREQNKKNYVVHAGSSEVFEMRNRVFADSGEYKYKVVINRENQKTNKEIISRVNIPEIKAKDEAGKSFNVSQTLSSEQDYDSVTGSVLRYNAHAINVYESVDERVKSLGGMFLVFLLVILSVVLIIGKF